MRTTTMQRTLVRSTWVAAFFLSGLGCSSEPTSDAAAATASEQEARSCWPRNKACRNGVRDCGETGIDCGGSCGACVDPCLNHCGNGRLDCGEGGVDCGGTCTACVDACLNHFGNGKLDCGEGGVDCGGTCTACVDPCLNHCGNGRLDCGESGVDCGGSCAGCAPSTTIPFMRGVNLAGADFGESALPGTYGVNYTYPTRGEVDHFMGLGMNVFRLPFRWERLQRSQLAAFDAAELSRIDAFVSYATGKGAYVLLDPHNYARYFGALIGSGVPKSAFADFWSRLAAHYKGNPRVVFGLMNEPHTMSTELWLADANAAIAAIRATGAQSLIMVPGNAWTGAHSWLQNWYGTPNGTVMLGIDDPLDHFVIELHQYLDGNSSGTDMTTCVSPTIGSQRLAAVTGWLQQHGLKAFLGEFGAGASTTCLAAIDDMLTYIDNHPNEWMGWAYWAAGPWWGNSTGSIEPVNGVDRPQTGVLVEHLP